MKKGFIFLPLLLVAAVPSFASSFFQGSDTACFYNSVQPPCTPVGTTTGIGINLAGDPLLTYTPNAAGFGAPATGGAVELGTFSLKPSLLGFEGLLGGHFNVDVAFSQPGGGGNTYKANTFGFDILFIIGGAEVTFQSPTTQAYSYPGGSFNVSLPDSPILILPGQTIALDAQIDPAPEPRTLGFLAFGLLLMGYVAYRRRSDGSASIQA